MEVIEQAFGEDLWIAEAMMAGESLNEIGTHRPGVGATTVKKRAKKAAQRALELAFFARVWTPICWLLSWPQNN